jgi:hypothetical protein
LTVSLVNTPIAFVSLSRVSSDLRSSGGGASGFAMAGAGGSFFGGCAADGGWAPGDALGADTSGFAATGPATLETIGVAGATCGSGVTTTCSVALAGSVSGGGEVGAAGGSIEAVGPDGAASGRASGWGARSMAAHPANDRTHRLAANRATSIAAALPVSLPRARAGASAGTGGSGEDICEPRVVFMAVGMEYNTKRHKREVDRIFDRLFWCP